MNQRGGRIGRRFEFEFTRAGGGLLVGSLSIWPSVHTMAPTDPLEVCKARVELLGHFGHGEMEMVLQNVERDLGSFPI